CGRRRQPNQFTGWVLLFGVTSGHHAHSVYRKSIATSAVVTHSTTTTAVGTWSEPGPLGCWLATVVLLPLGADGVRADLQQGALVVQGLERRAGLARLDDDLAVADEDAVDRRNLRIRPVEDEIAGPRRGRSPAVRDQRAGVTEAVVVPPVRIGGAGLPVAPRHERRRVRVRGDAREPDPLGDAGHPL